MLREFENISVSIPTIISILRKEFIISPKSKRKTKRELIKEIEIKEDTTKKKEITKLKQARIRIENSHIHPTRPRMKYMDELVQMDASSNGSYAHLYVTIDDCSVKILAAYLDKEEILNAYYHITHNMIINYGIPYALLTDKRTIFEYKLKSNKSLENDTFTQYAYACHRLGVDLRTTSSPQEKGRVERIFKTLQSRLVNLLRINNINDIESANMFLPQFIEAFNNKFSININNTLNVFQM